MDSRICSEGIRLLEAPFAHHRGQPPGRYAAWRLPEDGTALTHRLTGHRSRSLTGRGRPETLPRGPSRRTDRERRSRRQPTTASASCLEQSAAPGRGGADNLAALARAPLGQTILGGTASVSLLRYIVIEQKASMLRLWPKGDCQPSDRRCRFCLGAAAPDAADHGVAVQT